MALRLRISKFRHVYGAQCRREQTFENVRITRNTHDSNFCAVNPRFLAIVTESSGGGSFAVLDVNRPGRMDVNCPKVCGHEGAVMDIKWNPFDDCVIASGSDDATVKIWAVPEAGLLGTLTDWAADLHGHSRRIGYVEWHTTAANILMSVGFDFKIMIWNIEQAEPITSIDCHQDTIYSVSWAPDGSLLASTSKDKQIRVMDPRTSRLASKSDGHQSTKASKVVFVAENQLFTTGFSRISDRQYALWDIRKAGTPLIIEDLDSSSGILLPYYDQDTKVMYLAGKGDGNIRYFEVASDEGLVQFLNTYQSSLPQRGLGMMPKRGIDPFKNEVARFYKLHASKNVVEPLSMIVPRKAEGFQCDVFPPTASKIASVTADEWASGVNRGPILMDLQTGSILDRPRSSMSPAVVSQNPALIKPPQITTYRAVNRAPPTSLNSTHLSTGPAPFSKQTTPTGLRTSPEGHAQSTTVSSPSHALRVTDISPGFVNGRDHSVQELASITNMKSLIRFGDRHTSDRDSPQREASPTSSTSSGHSRTSRSPGSPQSFVSPPAVSPASTYNITGLLPASTYNITGLSPASPQQAPIISPTHKLTGLSPATTHNLAGLSPATTHNLAGLSPATTHNLTGLSPSPTQNLAGFPPSSNQHPHNGFDGSTHTDDNQQADLLSGSSGHTSPPSATRTGPHSSLSPPSATRTGPHSSVSLPSATRTGLYQRPQSAYYAAVPRHGTDMKTRYNTITGASNQEHVSAVSMVIGQSAVTSSHSHAIHVRKVWTPPQQTSPSLSPLTSSTQAGISSPGTDLELKKAYFRQLEEIRSLQEQLELKDKRIRELEREVAKLREQESDLRPGESNC